SRHVIRADHCRGLCDHALVALRLPYMSHASAAAPQTPPSGQDAGPVVELHGVSAGFDGPPVLQNISFSVAPAETRILLGPAGVGKSTLLKLIIGLIRPLEGEIRLFSEDLSSLPEE